MTNPGLHELQADRSIAEHQNAEPVNETDSAFFLHSLRKPVRDF